MIGKGVSRAGASAVTIVSLAVLVWIAGTGGGGSLGEQRSLASPEGVPFAQVYPIIQSRCLPCHSSHPSDATFGPSPGGVHFETPSQVQRYSERIRFRAIETKSMPLANRTQMTEEERGVLSSWIRQGARLE